MFAPGGVQVTSGCSSLVAVKSFSLPARAPLEVATLSAKPADNIFSAGVVLAYAHEASHKSNSKMLSAISALQCASMTFRKSFIMVYLKISD
jgi:hypothetical protein